MDTESGLNSSSSESPPRLSASACLISYSRSFDKPWDLSSVDRSDALDSSLIEPSDAQAQKQVEHKTMVKMKTKMFLFVSIDTFLSINRRRFPAPSRFLHWKDFCIFRFEYWNLPLYLIIQCRERYVNSFFCLRISYGFAIEGEIPSQSHATPPCEAENL